MSAISSFWPRSQDRIAESLYAGTAPGLVSGVFQIKARVPAEIEAGERIPIRVISGAISSPIGPSVAVK